MSGLTGSRRTSLFILISKYKYKSAKYQSRFGRKRKCFTKLQLYMNLYDAVCRKMYNLQLKKNNK